MATFEEAFKTYQDSGRGKTVSGMYDAQTNAGLSSLKSTYEQNLSDAQAARGNIDVAYRSNANNLGAQYERMRRNNNIQAAANGLNTGTASQMQLAQSGAYQRDYGNLMGQYGRDVAESERGMANLKATYQNAIQKAQADGDYKRMAALLDDYNTQYNVAMQQAQLLAGYGDFSGFSQIPGYNESQVNNMRQTWIAQNPLLAYNTGAITADQYYKMTGQYAPGMAPAAGGGSFGGRGRRSSSSSSSPNAETPAADTPIQPSGAALRKPSIMTARVGTAGYVPVNTRIRETQ